MQKQREHWASHLGFVLAAAGSAIGLGTLWKFPYVTGENGGGLFVLIYLGCVFFIGIPLFMAELVLGRHAQRGAVGIFASLSNDSTLWKAVGWLGVASSFMIMSYYSVIAGWGLNYVLMSLNQSYQNLDPEQIAGVFRTLQSSGDISFFWQMMFMGLTLAVVYPGIRHGVEYWSKFMTSALLVLLVVMFGYCITLDGFDEALHFVFYPDIAKFKPSSILDALGLSFFTLSLGQGIMLTYGSYMRSSDSIPKTGLIIGSMIVVVAVLASLIIFPIMFTFNVPPQGGEGLVFKTLPVLFSKLPGALILSTMFFALFVFTALTSGIAMIEAVAANLMDLLGWSRKQAVLVVGGACLLFGIPSALSETGLLFANWKEVYGLSFFETIDRLVSVWFLPVGGLLTAIFTGWIVDKAITRGELELGSTVRWIWRPWHFFIKWIAPVVILLILLQKSGILNIDRFFV